MRRLIVAFTVVLAAFQATGGGAMAGTQKELVTLKTRPGVTVEFLLIKPDKLVASVVLLEGGFGNLNLSGTRVGNDDGFLAASRDEFAARGLIVALVDAPSDRKGGRGMPPPFRNTRKHVKDIDAVIAWLKRKAPVPVWLVGVSRGPQSAVHVAIRSKEGIGGLVLASSMATVSERDKSVPVPSMSLDRITVPTLVVAHKRDGCEHTSPKGAEEITRGLTNASTVEVMYFEGGSEVGEDPCKPRTHHTFYGMEDEVVAAIAGFITANSAAPEKPSASAAQTARTAPAPEFMSEDEIRKTLVGNTIRFQNQRGRALSVFFGGDSSAVLATGQNPGRTVKKKWWFKDNGVLCRTVGKANREHCSKVAAGSTASVKFFKPNGEFRYEATMLEGKQL